MRKEILAKKEYKKPIARFVVFNYRDVVMSSDPDAPQVATGGGSGSGGSGGGDGDPQDELDED